jgi:hypothetical protein
MPFPQTYGWGGPQQQQFSAQANSQPPQYILDAMGGGYDTSRYYWNPDTMSLVERGYGGGSLYYGNVPDPSLGTNVVAGGQTYSFDPGVNPYFGFGDSAQNYAGGVAPNSGMFISGDPNEIADYRSHARDVVGQGVAQVGALVGGAAALGGTQWGQGGAATPAGGAATTYPYAAGGPVAVSPLAGGGAAAGTAAGAAGGGGAAVNALSGAERWLPYAASGVNALLGYTAAGDAADAESAAMQAAIEEQRRQYDQTRADFEPWMAAGRGALNQLADPRTNFMASPDYEFIRNEGTRGIQNQFAARGGAQSGNALRALSEFNSNLAAGDFNNWWNRQAGLAGVGQNATGTVANAGQNTSANVGNYLAGQGVSRASGIVGRRAALAGGINDGVSNWLYRRRAA